MLCQCKFGLLALVVIACPLTGLSAEPLSQRIDQLILAKADGQAASAVADDAEFLRRVYLDLAGRIPSVQEARSFLGDASADKRARLIDHLLSGPEYPRRLQEAIHVMLMERMGDSPEWAKYLRSSFEANKPWDQMVREILGSQAKDGATFFYTKRLENYGQNPVDYPGLTRDVGRLFLGMDLRCAECHNHMFIKEYKQEDFQGLHAFFVNTALTAGKGPVTEKVMTQKLGFQSVFKKVPRQTGPRIPGQTEIEIPVFPKGQEFTQPPDPKTRTPGVPKFSPLAKLAELLPTAGNPAFVKNSVNRFWFLMLGRGLVHPLDLTHSDNPPSHPELLDLLAKEFVEHKFDVKWLLREIALSQTYQRSSVLPKGAEQIAPESFLTAIGKRVSAEQLLQSVLEATGERQRIAGKELDTVQLKFQKAFAGPRREPEEDFAPSLKAALFVLNDDTVLAWLTPKDGNLVDRLTKLDDADKVAEELYLSVLTRPPDADEKKVVAEYLAKNGERKAVALGHLAWALLASTEFCLNH